MCMGSNGEHHRVSGEPMGVHSVRSKAITFDESSKQTRVHDASTNGTN